MTFVIDSISFEGEAIADADEQAIAHHEVAGADTPWTQTLGQVSTDIEIAAIVEDTEKALLAALTMNETHTFSDSVSGLSNETVWLRRRMIQEIAPGVWKIEMTLIRKGN